MHFTMPCTLCSKRTAVRDRAGADHRGSADDDECGAHQVGAGGRGAAGLHHHHTDAHDQQHRLWSVSTPLAHACILDRPLCLQYVVTVMLLQHKCMWVLRCPDLLHLGISRLSLGLGPAFSSLLSMQRSASAEVTQVRIGMMGLQDRQ